MIDISVTQQAAFYDFCSLYYWGNNRYMGLYGTRRRLPAVIDLIWYLYEDAGKKLTDEARKQRN
jgi:hypothetical protein